MDCFNNILWFLNQNITQSFIGVLAAWIIYSRWKNQHRLIEKSTEIANVIRKTLELNHKIIELRAGPKFSPLFDETYIQHVEKNYIPPTNEILILSFILSKELAILDNIYETSYATQYNQMIKDQLIKTIKEKLISFEEDLYDYEIKKITIEELKKSSYLEFINPLAYSSAIGKVLRSETGVNYVEDEFQLLANKNFDKFVTQLSNDRI